MFRRRMTLPLLTRVLHFMWPRTGWGRAVAYYWHRLQRIPGTPASIAAGFACGLGVSFTPFVGLHTILAFGAAWALRGSLLSAFIGTLLINPWTMPPIWISTYYFGTLLLPGTEYAAVPISQFIAMFGTMTRSLLRLDWPHFAENVLPIFWPMLVGGIPMGVAAGFVSYFLLEPPLRVLRARRAAKREEARSRRAATVLPRAGAEDIK
ncbi:MAG: DUF2062 domain-containing protein [Rhodobacteraceae bacterium]|nr:DUF2062 domain-containing protein [Paracoccaceae bacterium]